MKEEVITFTTKDPNLIRIVESAERVAEFPTTVLIQGESGTGKELLAKLLHSKSPRVKKQFVPVNCGAIPEGLVESELFGYVSGAFTDAKSDRVGLVEQAEGGTLFLDEISELPLNIQAKLLRILQERRLRRVGDNKEKDIDVRIVAANWKDLEQEVKKGNFREDLFFRLNVITFKIPPLKERPEDIPFLATNILKRLNKKLAMKVIGLSPQVITRLCDYAWPGNVRELENCLERAMVLSNGVEIKEGDLPENINGSATTNKNPMMLNLASESNLSLRKATYQLEENFIRLALEKTKGNRTHAAKILEISHRALLYKIKEYKIS